MKEACPRAASADEPLRVLVFVSLAFFEEKWDEHLAALFAHDVSPPGLTFFFKDHPSFGQASKRFAQRFGGRVVLIDAHDHEFHLAVCIGGDGCLLWLNQFVGRQLHLPVITINTGRVGFVAQFQTSDVARVLRALTQHVQGGAGAEPCELFPVPRIHCAVGGGGASGPPATAVNEVAVKATDNYYRKFDIFVDDVLVASANCDGLIVSSQVGSTAYNSSLRGPLLAPGCEALVVTAIAPFACGFRPLLVSKSQRLRIELGDGRHPDAYVYCDSANRQELAKGQHLSIELGPAVFSLVSSDHFTQWTRKVRELYHF